MLHKTEMNTSLDPPAMRVMVTGGYGLIGRNLYQVLLAQGFQETSQGCQLQDQEWIFMSRQMGDLRKESDVYRVFDQYQPTHIVHLAARVGGLFDNMKYMADFYNDNTAMNQHVLSWASLHQVKVISCLSTCIFPDKTTYPIDETMIHLGPPHSSNYGYAYAKRMVDIMNKAYNQQYGCHFTSIIPTNIYGPFDNFHLEASHVIPGLIHKCYLAKKNKTPFVVSGSGTPLRQFIFARDLAQLILWVLHEYKEIEPIILSVDEKDEISIKDVADAIVKEMEFDGEYRWDTSKADGQFKKTASNKKLRNYLPNFEFTPFEQGLRETVRWFIDHYDKARK